jgi:hypothetical protein
MPRIRKNHSPALKAKVAVEAINLIPAVETPDAPAQQA